MADIVKNVRTVFTAETSDLDAALSKSATWASAADSVGSDFGKRFMDSFAAEVRARAPSAIDIEGLFGDRLARARLDAMRYETSLAGPLSGHDAALLEEFKSGAELTGNSAVKLKGQIKQLTGEFGGGLMNAIRSATRGFADISGTLNVLGGIVETVIGFFDQLTDNFETAQWNRIINEFAALSTQVETLGENLKNAAAFAKEMKSAMGSAQTRALSAKVEAAKASGDYSMAGIYQAELNKLEAKQEVAKLRDEAKTAKESADKTQKQRDAAAKNVSDLDRKIAQAKAILDIGDVEMTEEGGYEKLRKKFDLMAQNNEFATAPNKYGQRDYMREDEVRTKMAEMMVIRAQEAALLDKYKQGDVDTARDAATQFEETASTIESAIPALVKQAIDAGEKRWMDIDLGGAKRPHGGDTNIDARGSRITVNESIRTDDPARLAGAELLGAFQALVRRPLSATFGLGTPSLATGGR